MNVYSLVLQGQPKKQIRIVGARWLVAAAGEAEHAFVSMLKHDFGPEGES